MRYCRMAALIAVALCAACQSPAREGAGMGLPLGGIRVKRGGTVLLGSPANCSRPATVRLVALQKATPEWKTIRRDNVRKGSARYDLLIAQMNRRIRRAVRLAAEEGRRDCVVREADLVDSQGLTVIDITTRVRRHLST